MLGPGKRGAAASGLALSEAVAGSEAARAPHEVRALFSGQKLQARLRAGRWMLVLGLGAWLLWAGLIHSPGPHDNDWPLLMWLVKHSSLSDPSPLAIGHYGPAQLLLAWWLHPVFGSTLAAAKVLSTLATLVVVSCLYLMTPKDQGEVPGLMAAAAFALSAPALQTGQSEFADALASAAFFWGLWGWWRSGERHGLLAGICMGAAGLMRTHFVFFSIGAALLAGLLGVLRPPAGGARRASAKAGLWLLAGTVLGNLPGFLLNLRVHGQLGSAVAHTFVGQVLYGMDELDLLSTYAAHPLGEILRERPLDVVRLMAERARAHPALWGLPLATGLVALVRWRRWPAAIVRQVLLVSSLAFGYFWLFVSLAWWSSPRLLFPITALNSWLVVVVSARLLWGASPQRRVAGALAFAAALAVQWPSTLEQVRARWRESRHWWALSSELVQTLRDRGMKDAREAFVFDWNRFVVDDPQLQPFYNFGFWNLLIPRFREERPIPTPYLNSLGQLGRFLQRQNVRFFALPKDPRRLQRFPALVRLVQNEATLPGFRRDAVLGEDLLFASSPPVLGAP